MKSSKIIIDAIGSSFLRVMKNENCLPIFKKSLFQYLQEQNNDFSHCKSFNEVMYKIYQLAKDNPQSMPHSNPKYIQITTMINLLLHFFLENKGVPFQMLGNYGQTIFDLSCYKIFGDSYLQEKKNDEEDMQNKIGKQIDPLDQFIYNLYIKETQTDPNIDWDTFYKKIKKHLSVIVKQIR